MEEIYSEVNEILNLLGKSYIDRLPKKLYNLILESEDKEHKVKFKSIDEISINNCKKETIDIIALFHLNYWCENEEEKEELNKKLMDNYIINEQLKKEKFDLENIFKNKSKEIMVEQEDKKELIEYKPQNFIQRLFNKIKNLFIKK